MKLLAQLRPADILLYKPRGFFGWVISVKTWHQVAHVEAYVGDGFTVASRDGVGVGKYTLRADDLTVVCRPLPPFDLARALRWFDKQKGTPYGWADLFQFIGWKVDADGIICSSFATRFLRNGGVDPFNGEDALKVAPFQFALSNCFEVYDVKDETLIVRAYQPEPEQAA